MQYRIIHGNPKDALNRHITHKIQTCEQYHLHGALGTDRAYLAFLTAGHGHRFAEVKSAGLVLQFAVIVGHATTVDNPARRILRAMNLPEDTGYYYGNLLYDELDEPDGYTAYVIHVPATKATYNGRNDGAFTCYLATLQY